MLFASRELRIGKNCVRGLVFPNTDRPGLVNSVFFFSLKLKEILYRRTQMIEGCNYSNIFYKLNSF